MSAAEKYDSKYSMPRTQSEIMESRREVRTRERERERRGAERRRAVCCR